MLTIQISNNVYLKVVKFINQIFFAASMEQAVRDSITLIGLDLKITRELDENPELKCIEINGATSGIQGYFEAHGNDSGIVQNLAKTAESFNLPVYVAGLELTQGQTFSSLPFNLASYAKDMSRNTVWRPNPVNYMSGIPQKSWIHNRLRPKPWHNLKLFRDTPEEPGSWANVETIIFDRTYATRRMDSLPGIVYYGGHREVFNEGRVMVANSPGIEALLYDKSLTGLVFEDTSLMLKDVELTFLSILAKMDKKHGTKRMLKVFDGKYGVVKPNKGSNGSYVEIAPVSAIMRSKKPEYVNAHMEAILMNAITGRDYAADILEKESTEMMVQEFVPGKPVQNPATRRMHSATMRYLVIMTSQNNNIQVNPIGGYWRLAPYPLDSHRSLNDRHIANLHPRELGKRKAIPVPLAEADEAFVVGQLNSMMPLAYGRMLEYESHMLHGTLNEYLREGLIREFSQALETLEHP